MKYFYFLCFLLFSCSNDVIVLEETEDVFMQQELTTFQHYSLYINYSWEDSITSRQTKYYQNGLAKVEYEDIGNGKKLRKDYFHNGSLESTAVVYQKYGNDTTWQINAITLEDEQFVNIGFQDYIDGKYLKFNILDLGEFYWSKLQVETQIKYWLNDSIKVRYEIDENGNRLRYDYNDTGDLLRESIVKQKFFIDTMWQINRHTLEDEQVVREGYKDFFEEIIFLKEFNPIITGQFKNNIKTGEWLSFKDEIITSVHYNDNGDLDGTYKEYYPTLINIKRLKCSGHFKKKLISDTTENSYGTTIVTSNKYIRSGKWKFYNEDESIHSIVKY